MIIAIKNFMRNRMVNLTALSVRHFLPQAEIHCFTLYKNSPEDYASQEPLADYVIQHWGQTQFVSGNKIHDHRDPRLTSGFAHPDNGCFFTEGYNVIHEHFMDTEEKVLMLSEDHFFTTGAVLRELVENDWDVAYADGDSPDASRANGSILGIRPAIVKQLFPIPLSPGVQIEWIVAGHLLRHIPEERLYRIQNRKWIDYCGDGLYTNSSDVMAEELRKAGIL